MNFIVNLFQYALAHTWTTLASNWVYLLVSIIISACIQLYVNQDQLAAFLKRNRRGSVVIATAAAVGTPLCSCGTTAVVIGMMASVMPWAPIIAFMVASPLTSPEELFYSAGLFGWNFALAFFAASIFLGLLGGAAAGFADSRGWLAGQARIVQPALNLSLPMAALKVEKPVVTPKMLARKIYENGRRLLVFFLVFAFVGYLLNGLIPAEWVATLFGEGRAYGVPLAATLGLPFYINTEASLPLVRAMLENGMSQGAALAFLVTGAGTSIGAIMGALTIARWRVIAIVIGTLWVGAVITGVLFNFLAI